MHKLVRDALRFNDPEKYPGQVFELAKPAEMKELLIRKLEEETGAVIRALNKLRTDCRPPAPDKLDLNDSLVDLFEVLRKISISYGFGTEKHIIENASMARRFRGGFDAGVVLVTDRKEMKRSTFKKLYEKKAKTFLLNEQHTTHVTKSQARRERQSYKSANAAARARLKRGKR